MASMPQDDIRNELLALLETAAVEHDVDIVDVEVVGSAKAPTVRVRIDHADEQADPITLDEVSAETGWISDLIDVADPIEGRYMLEVSSPGMSRPLRKARDFERFAGNDVSLTLNVSEGRRRYTGKLEGLVDGNVRVTTDEGPFEFELSSIRSCTIKPDFGEQGKKGHASHAKKGKR